MNQLLEREVSLTMLHRSVQQLQQSLQQMFLVFSVASTEINLWLRMLAYRNILTENQGVFFGQCQDFQNEI